MEAHRGAANAIVSLMNDAQTREACREVAERRLSLDGVGIPAYLALYQALAFDRNVIRRLSARP